MQFCVPSTYVHTYVHTTFCTYSGVKDKNCLKWEMMDLSH